MRKNLPVKWSHDAIEQLNAIHEFIKIRSPQNAKHVVQTLFQLGDSLGYFPEKYPIEPYLAHLNQNFRSVPKWSYKIIFEVTSDSIIIVKIFDTYKDPNKIHKDLV